MNTDALPSRAPVVGRLAADRAAEVVRVVCDAFAGYPVMQFVLGAQSRDYRERLALLAGFFVQARLLRGEPVLGLADGSGRLIGAALLSDPAGESPAELAGHREQLWEVLGAEARTRYEQFGAAVSDVAIDDPHLHLNMLAVVPANQGRGCARPLLNAVHALAAATAGGLGVSLSTEAPRNVALYEHFGYRTVGVRRVSPDLQSWVMFRRAGR